MIPVRHFYARARGAQMQLIWYPTTVKFKDPQKEAISCHDNIVL
jgi:hypothetical protein